MANPLRILHVVGGMPRAGAETWLMGVLRKVDPERYRMDFLVHTTEPKAYDEEIRSLGARVLPCLAPSQPLRYARSFQRIMRDDGPWDIVHSHVHYFSGYALLLARRAGVPVRVAHSHNDSRRAPSERSAARWLYRLVQRQLIDLNATHGLAVSAGAAEALFGSRWAEDGVRVMPLGIDLASFGGPVDRSLRAGLGIPADALVLGHVGRLTEQKNHAFLLEVLKEAVARDPRCFGLFVGEGPLRPALEARARALGIHDRIRWTGVRADVPTLLRSCMDVFVFPSLYEGMGLALVEAQAAGLPCLAPEHLPPEVAVTRRLHLLPLDAGAAAWAELAVQEARNSVSTAPPDTSGWPFDLERSTRTLLAFYDGTVQAGVR